MDRDKLLELKAELLMARDDLDGCWGHDSDGSELMKSPSELFDMVFNKILHHIGRPITTINNILEFPKDEYGHHIYPHYICRLCGKEKPSAKHGEYSPYYDGMCSKKCQDLYYEVKNRWLEAGVKR